MFAMDLQQKGGAKSVFLLARARLQYDGKTIHGDNEVSVWSRGRRDGERKAGGGKKVCAGGEDGKKICVEVPVTTERHCALRTLPFDRVADKGRCGLVL